MKLRKIILMIAATAVVAVSMAACGKTNPEQNTGTQENNSFGTSCDATLCNIDTDRLPYNEESIYQQLFDINNKIEVELDVSDKTLKQLQKDYETYDWNGSKSPIYREANLKITITTEKDSVTYAIDNVGIRMKGNTSRIDFYDNKEGQYNLIHFKVDFGERTFATLEKLELRWNKNDDSTYAREYYAYEMYRDFGVLAPHINLTTMKVAGEHQGVFTICEPVDEVFIDKYVAKTDRGGNLYKCNWAGIGANLTSKCTVGVENEEKGKFYNYDLKTNKTKADHTKMKNLLAVLNRKGVNKEDIAKVVDMDKFLAFEAVTYFTGNPDDIRNDYNNYYIYFLASSGKAIFIPYDVDRVFGLTKDWNPTGDAMTNIDPFSTRAESMGIEQENPLYIHTVNKGGFYTEEFKTVLQKVAESKWLTTDHFNGIYETVYDHYVQDTKPEKTYGNAEEHNFTMSNTVSDGLGSTKGNASFEEYLDAKLKSYQNYVK
jgi:spore coat protein CotH